MLVRETEDATQHDGNTYFDCIDRENARYNSILAYHEELLLIEKELHHHNLEQIVLQFGGSPSSRSTGRRRLSKAQKMEIKQRVKIWSATDPQAGCRGKSTPMS